MKTIRTGLLLLAIIAVAFPATAGEDYDYGTLLVGEEIGTLQALHGRYPQITNHCHIDISLDGQFINPESLIV